MGVVRAGLLFVSLVSIAVFFGFTKLNPFSNLYEVKGVFQSAMNLKKGTSEVRIAGVEVGYVKKIQPMGPPSTGALVTMQIQKSGLPIHTDAAAKIRQQLFLEGNYFIDLKPGSPSAPELEDGSTLPINQTAIPVQFTDVLTALQSDTRRDLRTLLAEYAFKGLNFGGAEGFNNSIEYWEPAYKSNALVNDALLGTRPGDLRRVVSGQQKTFRALSDNEGALKDLITNLNTTAAALAREDDSLREAIPALRDVVRTGRPALRSLASSLPSLRRFAEDALPGVRSSGPTLDALVPFVAQLRALMQPSELRGLVDDLDATVPALARLNRRSVPIFAENRALSACSNNVLIPFSETPIPNPDESEGGDRDQNPNNNGPNSNDDQLVMRQAPRGLVGLAGESRISDANSPQFRVNFSGGLQGLFFNSTSQGNTFAAVPDEVTGSRPALPSRRQWDFRPDVPCETQEPPNLEAPLGGQPQQRRFSLDQLPDLNGEQLGALVDTLGSDASPEKRKRIEARLKKELRDRGFDIDKNGKIIRLRPGAGKPAPRAAQPAPRAAKPAPQGKDTGRPRP